MATATLTTKGQITIPVDVRRAPAGGAGGRGELGRGGPGRGGVAAATHSVRELKGRFGTPKRAISIDEMNAAIASQGSRTR